MSAQASLPHYRCYTVYPMLPEILQLIRQSTQTASENAPVMHFLLRPFTSGTLIIVSKLMLLTWTYASSSQS